MESLVKDGKIFIKIKDALGLDQEEQKNSLEMLLNENPGHSLMLDLEKNHWAGQKTLRFFAGLQQTLKQKSRKAFLANSLDEDIKFLKTSGVLSEFIEVFRPTSASKPETSNPSTAPKLDVNFLNPFVDGTIDTLRVQCNYEVTPGKPSMKSPEMPYNYEIAANIGLTSDTFNGSIAICFPAPVFLGIMSEMLGEEFTEIDDELQDGAAELLNIIFGQAKKTLNERGYSIQKAIPTIIRGEKLRVNHLTTSPIMLIPFSSKDGDFSIEIALD
jgi:chemotaxis protein CheX